MLSFKQYVHEQSVVGGFNIARADMPQITDQDAFAAYLEFVGVQVIKLPVPVSNIKPTQVEFDQAKVDSIKAPYGSIIVADDNFILDGHHRFFAAKADVDCDMIDAWVCATPINQLLKHAYEFLSDE